MDQATPLTTAPTETNTPPGQTEPGGTEPARERDLPFLVRATRELAGAGEVEAALAGVVRLALPHLGAWCVVDLCEGEHVRRLAVVHAEPAGQEMADALLAGWAPHRDDALGITPAVRAGRREAVAPVTDEMLAASARSPETLAILRALETGSVATVPLLARGELLGAITFVGRDPLSERDLVLAEDLAARCALALDNARLLQAAERARGDADAANALAEEANLIKMRFLATMSHELRTPLNAIAGYAELLESGVRGDLDEAQLVDVRRIQVNQRHLLGLVEAVLSFAKIDAGRIEFGLGDVALAGVLAEANLIVAPLAAEKEISCVGCAPAPDEAPVVYADPDKLRQILVNLMGNAIKFSAPGARVEVTHHLAGANLQICVTDTGIGIAQENWEKIFQPFVQVEDDLARAHEGTGLGLAISRELAVGMGGGLTVESEPGRGSTFTVTLSRGRGEGQGVRATSPAGSSAAPSPASAPAA